MSGAYLNLFLLSYELLNGTEETPEIRPDGSILHHYNFSGGGISIRLPPGYYKFICKGAAGGYGIYSSTGLSGGPGALTSGELKTNQTKVFWLQIGGAGGNAADNTSQRAPGGYNGGGSGGLDTFQTIRKTGGGGGGATDIRLSNNNINSRIMVAAGGSGSTGTAYGAPGGDTTGYRCLATQSYSFAASSYTTQTRGNALGYGANGEDSAILPSSGAGGGYYGGVKASSSTLVSLSYTSISDSGSSYISSDFLNPSMTVFFNGINDTEERNGYIELLIYYECNETCQTCSSAGPNCDTCPTGKYLDLSNGGSPCVDSCSSNSYSNDFTCYRCDSQCATCVGNATSCTSCDSHSTNNLYDVSHMSCTDSCPDHRYQSSNNCLMCDPSCATCIGSSTNCLSCPSGWYWNRVSGSQSCIEECPEGTYIDGNECKLCHSSCRTCSNDNNDACLTCPDGYYIDRRTSIYPSVFCYPSANDCPSGSYPSDYECKECDPSCQECFDHDSSSCTACPSSTYLYLGECLSNCPEGTYAYGIECIQCDRSCKKCNGPHGCTECASGFTMDSSSNICNPMCSSHNYYNQTMSSCESCNSVCSECKGPEPTNCTLCPPTSYEFADSHQLSCLENCPPHTFPSVRNDPSVSWTIQTCSACSDDCDECNSYSSCLSCNHGKYLYGSLCVTTCPARTYPDENTGTCVDCYSTCQACNGSNSNDCLSCISSSMYFSPSSALILDNSFLQTNNFNNSILQTNNFTILEKQMESYSFDYSHFHYLDANGQCLSSCPLGTFPNSSSICENCHDSCETCSGPSSNDCLTCPSGKFMNRIDSTHSECLDSCPSNSFESGIECQRCDPSCLTCSGSGSSNCSSCTSDYIYLNGYCVSSCPPRTYRSSSTCLSCDSTCASCSGGSDTECTSCSSRYVDRNTEGEFKCVSTVGTNQYLTSGEYGMEVKNCPSLCETCNGGGLYSCLSCKPTAKQFVVGSYFGCFNTCPDSTYESGNYCILCNESCLTCSGSRNDQCTSCQDGSFLLFGSCVSTCPSNTYSNTISNECQNCSSNCQTCLGTSSSQCLSCSSNFPYFSREETDSGFMLTCKEKCDENEYMIENSTECFSCHSSCKTCSGKEENECTSCPDGSNLNDGKCVTSSSKKMSTTTIVLIILGAGAFMIIVFLIILLVKIQKKKKKISASKDDSSYSFSSYDFDEEESDYYYSYSASETSYSSYYSYTQYSDEKNYESQYSQTASGNSKTVSENSDNDTI